MKQRLGFVILIATLIIALVGCGAPTANLETTASSGVATTEQVSTSVEALEDKELDLLTNEFVDTQLELSDLQTLKFDKDDSNYDNSGGLKFIELTEPIELLTAIGVYPDEAVKFYLDARFSIELPVEYTNVEYGSNRADGLDKYQIIADQSSLATEIYNINFFHNENNQINDIDLVDKVRLRGGTLGWTATDLFYMVQYRDYLTGEPLDKPIVTTIIPNRKAKNYQFSPLYERSEQGALTAKWQPVPGADAYGLVSYYKYPSKQEMMAYIEEYNQNQHKMAEENENYIVNERYLKQEYDQIEIFDKYGYITSYTEGQTYQVLVGITEDTEIDLGNYVLVGSTAEQDLVEGFFTAITSSLETARMQGANRYLSVVALKETADKDFYTADYEPMFDSTTEQNDEDDSTGLDIGEGLFEKPNYYAFAESNLYDFDVLAASLPEFMLNNKENSENASSEVTNMSQIPATTEVMMVDGNRRKVNLVYDDEYTIRQDLDNRLQLWFRLKDTPFRFSILVSEFNEDSLQEDIANLVERLTAYKELRADLLPHSNQAPIISIDYQNQVITISNAQYVDENLSNSSGSSSGGASDVGLAPRAGGQTVSPRDYYDEALQQRMVDTIYGDEYLTRALAEKMMFGETVIKISNQFTSDEIWGCFNEANWQNQLILENDNIDAALKPFRDGSYELYINYIFSNIEQRKQMQVEMLNKADYIINSLGIDKNDINLTDVYDINNYIIDRAEYHHPTADQKIDRTTKRTAYGVLIEGSGVCSSYARAFQFVLRNLNLSCLVDIGKAGGGGHAWSLVRMAGDEWYIVDATWNDSTYPNKYLMVPHNYAQTHESNFKSFSIYSDFRYTYQPSYNNDYDYLNYIGKSIDSYKIDQLLAAYHQKGYFPKYIRYEGYVDSLDDIKAEIKQFMDDYNIFGTYWYSYNKDSSTAKFKFDFDVPTDKGFWELD